MLDLEDYAYSPRIVHIGSWKTAHYAECALVETDSYVLQAHPLGALMS